MELVDRHAGVHTLALAGGRSVANASGSALSTSPPSAPSTSYLYLSPTPTPGTNSSQTPEEPSTRIGFRRPSQRLKSPTTRTARALGAHTAKAVPATPSSTVGWAPSRSHSR